MQEEGATLGNFWDDMSDLILVEVVNFNVLIVV